MTAGSAKFRRQEKQTFQMERYLPFLDWLLRYRREYFVGDVIAGVIVAIMLVPQGMAYALLAGLPPQMGLYASIIPPIVYALLGTSRALAVGPVALVSLLVAGAIGEAATPGSGEYVFLAITLALLIGLVQLLMGLLRIGFLTNFLSQPVLSGFVSAVAIITGLSQLQYILGIVIPRTEYVHETILFAINHISETNPVALSLSLGSMVILVLFKNVIASYLKRSGIRHSLIIPIVGSGSLVVVALGTLVVWLLGLNEHNAVAIVGEVPAGAPPLMMMPSFDFSVWRGLFSSAVTIALVSFVASLSVGKSLAGRKSQPIDSNQELIALGAANLSAAFTGGCPVTGGFARSVVNFTAGANTGLASFVTALLMLLTVLFLTPLFFFLPHAVLSSIIVVAVWSLIDFRTVKRTWRYNKADALSLVITFFAVLLLGMELGIMVGVGAALVFYLWRTSRPHIALVGLENDGIYRANSRHETQFCPAVLGVRVDGNLYFPNAQYLEDHIIKLLAEYSDVRHVVLVCNGINYIDATALESLKNLHDRLQIMRISFSLAEVKTAVLERLERTGFVERIGREQIFVSAHEAMQILSERPPMQRWNANQVPA